MSPETPQKHSTIIAERRADYARALTGEAMRQAEDALGAAIDAAAEAVIAETGNLTLDDMERLGLPRDALETDSFVEFLDRIRSLPSNWAAA